MSSSTDRPRLLIYDGDCGFCTAAADWFRTRLEPGSSIDVLPWQALDLDSYDLTIDKVTSAAYWRGPSGDFERGHRAVGGALCALGGGWRLVGRSISIPPISWVAALCYRIVAANRHRLPGATCAIGERS